MDDDRIAVLEGEIRAIQGDLVRDLDALADHLPAKDDLVKLGGVAAAVLVGGYLVLTWLLGRRKRKREDKRLKRLVREAVDEATR